MAATKDAGARERQDNQLGVNRAELLRHRTVQRRVQNVQMRCLVSPRSRARARERASERASEIVG